MSTEALIVVGLFAFYLYDAIVPLGPREMVLAFAADRVVLSAPYPYVTLQHRIPWMANPLTPHRTLFRLSWSAAEDVVPRDDLATARRIADTLRPVGLVTLVTAATMLLGLPAIALTSGIGTRFLAGLVATYALVATMLAMVHARRVALGLATRDIGALAFDALACPPFALNLVRKVGLRQRLDIDPLAVARDVMPRTATPALWRALRRHLDDELLQVADDSVEAASLRALYADLEGKLS